MQASQQQYHGSAGQTNYTSHSSDLQQGTSNYPPPYHSSYSSDASQPYSNAHSTVPYNGQPMNSYNPSYRPPMNQDIYNSGQQYGRMNQPHYQNWERDNQSFNSIPPPNGPVRSNQVQMPPPHPHFNHQQMAVSSPSHSPRSWPSAIPQHSPRATPSPMAVQGIPSPSLSTRSPGLGKQFSPSPGLPNVNHSFEFSAHQNNSSSPSPSNNQMNPASVSSQSSTTPAVVDSNDPLQSLQKMVMIESQPVESPVERANYEISSNSSLHTAQAPKCAPDFSNVEQLASNEYGDSPEPTYYNLDEGKTVNSKLNCMEETSQGSYGSEHGVGDPHFQSVPSIEHMNYNQPIKGIPVDDPSAYHPVHQNGYPQHMYPQNPYSNINIMPQKPGRRKQKKYDGNFAEINNPPGKRKRKGRPLSPTETYSPNYYPNNMPSEYQNPAYNMTGLMNGPMMLNDDSSEMPVIVPKKRTYTKRKVKKMEINAHNNPTNVGADGSINNGSIETEACVPKPKRKYSPRRKLSDPTRDVKNTTPIVENKCLNGRVSPVSISTFDGPVKITKVPNIISNSNDKKVAENEQSPPIIPSFSIKTKSPLLREVSVKIVPLSDTHPERTIVNSQDTVKSENCSETESISNSVCSTAYSIPANGTSHQNSAEEVFNSADSPIKKKGRPKGRLDSENCPRQKKSKEKLEEKLDVDDKSNDLRKFDDKSRTQMGTPSGPYVHIEGSRDNPSLITIINTNVKDEVKKDSKQPHTKIQKHISNSFGLKRKFGNISTLSAAYDTLTKDKSWVCVLCHKGSHCEELGDLFGPYCDLSLQIPPSDNLCTENIKNSVKNECDNISNQRTSSRLRKRRSDGSEPIVQSNKDAKQGKSKESAYPPNSTIPFTINNHVSNSCKVSGDESSTNSQSLEQSPDTSVHEFWVHEECILWANGVYIVGNKVIGIEEAVRVAMEMICTHCGKHGATLGCLAKNCVEKLHVVCAKEKGCLLDECNFSVRCPQHEVINVKERS